MEEFERGKGPTGRGVKGSRAAARTRRGRCSARAPLRRLPAILFVFAILGVLGCQSSPEPLPQPPAGHTAAQPDPLGDEVPRTDQTVLEALWDLEKAVRDKDRRIAELEAELARVREALERLRRGEDPGNKEQKDQRNEREEDQSDKGAKDRRGQGPRD